MNLSLLYTLPNSDFSVILFYILNLFIFYKFIYKNLFIYKILFIYFIIALQNCVGFCQTSTWNSHKYTYTPFLLNLPPISLPTPPLQVVIEPWFDFPESFCIFYHSLAIISQISTITVFPSPWIYLFACFLVLICKSWILLYLLFFIFIDQICFIFTASFHSIQSLSLVRLFATLWAAARQVSLSITSSWSLLKATQAYSCPSNDRILLSSPSPPAFNLSQHPGFF